jgi:hypothetical protein
MRELVTDLAEDRQTFGSGDKEHRLFDLRSCSAPK